MLKLLQRLEKWLYWFFVTGILIVYGQILVGQLIEVYKTETISDVLEVGFIHLSIIWMIYTITRLMKARLSTSSVYSKLLKNHLDRKSLYREITSSKYHLTFPSNNHWLPVIYGNHSLPRKEACRRLSMILTMGCSDLEYAIIGYTRGPRRPHEYYTFKAWMRVSFGLRVYRRWIQLMGGIQPLSPAYDHSVSFISAWETNRDYVWDKLVRQYGYYQGNAICINNVFIYHQDYLEVSTYILEEGLSKCLSEIQPEKYTYKPFIQDFIKTL